MLSSQEKHDNEGDENTKLNVSPDLADASQRFSFVADMQQSQNRQAEAQRSLDSAYLHPEIQLGGDSHETLSANKLSFGRWAFVFFTSLVVGALIALNVFSIYIGIDLFREDCNQNLAPWAITQGFLGLLSTALVLAVSIPDGLAKSTSARAAGHALLRHRIQPPSFSTGTIRGERNRRLVGVLGLVQFIMLSWFVVGTVWVAHADRQLCPNGLYIFVLVYTIIVWIFILGLCVLSTFVAVCKHPGLSRRQSGSAPIQVSID
mmetsp:Transcript_16187/g.31323  ORF Transcript_16187/g.31323 Transcript_16187/m.31323 type:complete len:262 (-) Transcript_16187:331-1116(-)